MKIIQCISVHDLLNKLERCIKICEELGDKEASIAAREYYRGKADGYRLIKGEIISDLMGEIELNDE